MSALWWRRMLALGLTIGAFALGCAGPTPAPTPQPTESPQTMPTPGIGGIPPPPQVSRAITHDPLATDDETSQAVEYETPLAAAAVVQFYQEELPRRGWVQDWDISGERHQQVGFGRGDKETVIVVVSRGASLTGEAGTPANTTVVGIIYITVND